MESTQSIRHITDTEAVFSILKEHDAAEGRLFILADSQTSEHCLPLIQNALPGAGRNTVLLNVANGEQTKTLETAGYLFRRLIEYQADRHSILLNVGGGMVTDLGGFVASTYKRGMRFINIPTTVLAQVDAGIGGKTGVNHLGFKNMIGTFSLPIETIIYPEFLNTLPKREVLAGFAEMLKHAIIASETLWQSCLDAHYIDLPFIKACIPEAIAIKQDIVSKDPEDSGERKTLNFGHTIGHALESFAMESAGRDLLHGEAVALGMIAESHISYQRGYISETLLNQLAGFISKNFKGLDLHDNQFHRIIEITRQDKKKDGNKLNMTLIKGIGEAVVDKNPSMEMIIDSLTYLQRFPFAK
jgi:3-dehydroquinate synthase